VVALLATPMSSMPTVPLVEADMVFVADGLVGSPSWWHFKASHSLPRASTPWAL